VDYDGGVDVGLPGARPRRARGEGHGEVGRRRSGKVGARREWGN
jgi:hypothetical protein